MIHRDYIMRMIEQLSNVVAKVLFHKNAQQFELAEKELDLAASQLFGLDSELLESMAADDIISLLHLDSVVNAGKSLVLAEILKEKAEVVEMAAQNTRGQKLYLKSLRCYLEGLRFNSGLAQDEVIEKVNFVLRKLDVASMPPELQARLFPYFEATGNFAKAEDVLFNLVALAYPDIQSEGLAFFARLLAKSDEELENGQLLRDEVAEGCAEFKRLFGA